MRHIVAQYSVLLMYINIQQVVFSTIRVLQWVLITLSCNICWVAST